MTLRRTHVPLLTLGAFGALALAGATTRADEYAVSGARLTTTASRCAAYGVGYIDLGNGTCARTGNHVRVEFGDSRAASEGWVGGRTSSAELRSEGGEYLPGVGTSHQLRVRSGLQTLSPY